MKQQERGISIVEALIALVIGLGVLSAGIGFFVKTTRTIQIGQENAENTAVAQQVLARMTREIKAAAVSQPRLFNATPVWSNLPALPYTAKELTPYPNTAGVVIDPAAPAARKFSAQSASGIENKWYPNPEAGGSNSLVFYKALPPAPGGTTQIERVTYRLDGTELIKEVQRPLSASSNNFQNSPAPLRNVMAKEVSEIQFTYPIFMQQMNAALDTQLTDIQTNQSPAEAQRFMNENYRKVIGIRIVMQGARIGNDIKPGIELTTEVRLRSE